MTRLDKELSQHLSNIASEIQPADAERVTARAMLASGTPRASQRRWLAFAGGLAAAAVTVTALSATGMFGTASQDQERHSAVAAGDTTETLQDGAPLEIKRGTPCVGATTTTLTAVLARPEVPDWVPAPGPRRTGAWFCAGDMPAISFEAGTVFYERGWGATDIDRKWADLIADYGGYIEQIDGRTALVQPATDPGTKAQIMIVEGDTLVRVLGEPSASAQDLIDIADGLTLDSHGQ